MADNANPEYLLYLRKSVGRAGVARQRTVTTAYISQQGGTVAGEYVDTDRTAYRKIGAARPVREGWDRMLADLAARPGVRIAAWHADRLLRDTEDTEDLIRRCAAGGHLVETPRGGVYDLSTATGRKRLRSDAVDAAFEVDHAIERITAAKDEAAMAGEDLGGRRRFGWHVVRSLDSRRFLVAGSEAELIRSGTRSIISGVSLAAVSRQWNASGVRTSTGRAWTPHEVARVLQRARNAGLMEHRGQVAGPGNWPAIVTEPEWRAVRAILADPARRTTPGPGRRWLLSGIARCGVCEGPLIVSMTAGRGRPARPVYRCRPAGGRGHVARDVAALDAWVRDVVIARMALPDAALPAPAGPDMTMLRAEEAGLQAELDELARAAGARTITPRQLVIASEPIRAGIERVQQRIAAAVRGGVLDVFRRGSPGEVWERLDLDQRRAVVRTLMTVTVHPAPRGRPAGWRPGESYFHSGSVEILPAERQ